MRHVEDSSTLSFMRLESYENGQIHESHESQISSFQSPVSRCVHKYEGQYPDPRFYLCRSPSFIRLNLGIGEERLLSYEVLMIRREDFQLHRCNGGYNTYDVCFAG